MDEKFIIQGGRPLKGEVKIRGAKNAAFPIIAASLLTKEDCFIDNIPLIEDVFKMLEIMENIGAKVTWLGERKIKLNCKDIDPLKLPFNIISRLRGSVLILGPLLARFKEIKIVSPGG
jgi:UDP-N-acetylglucosamine 1-carboxyvinyltransferase